MKAEKKHIKVVIIIKIITIMYIYMVFMLYNIIIYRWVGFENAEKSDFENFSHFEDP